jgi:hypothetical protein
VGGPEKGNFPLLYVLKKQIYTEVFRVNLAVRKEETKTEELI